MARLGPGLAAALSAVPLQPTVGGNAVARVAFGAAVSGQEVSVTGVARVVAVEVER